MISVRCTTNSARPRRSRTGPLVPAANHQGDVGWRVRQAISNPVCHTIAPLRPLLSAAATTPARGRRLGTEDGRRDCCKPSRPRRQCGGGRASGRARIAAASDRGTHLPDAGVWRPGPLERLRRPFETGTFTDSGRKFICPGQRVLLVTGSLLIRNSCITPELSRRQMRKLSVQ